jgi:hypothetical protein
MRLSYDDGLAQAPADLAAIATLTADNPLQHHRIARLTMLVGQEIQLASVLRALRFRVSAPLCVGDTISNSNSKLDANETNRTCRVSA